MSLLSLSCSLALAGEWARQPIDPRVTTDLTAYTVGKGNFKLGFVNQDFGLLENVQVGTTLGLLPLGVVAVHGKVTAVEGERVALGIEGGWLRYRFNTDQLTEEISSDASATAVPLNLTTSVILGRRLSIHGGPAWLFANVAGAVPLDQVGVALAAMLGSSFGGDLTEDVQSRLEQKAQDELEDKGSIFADARMTVTRINLAADFRINRRDSIFVAAMTPVGVKGLVAAGYQTDEAGLSAGASLLVDQPLDEFGSTITVSYQAAWPHLHLRVGFPLYSTVRFAWIPQAFDVYWVF